MKITAKMFEEALENFEGLVNDEVENLATRYKNDEEFRKELQSLISTIFEFSTNNARVKRYKEKGGLASNLIKATKLHNKYLEIHEKSMEQDYREFLEWSNGWVEKIKADENYTKFSSLAFDISVTCYGNELKDKCKKFANFMCSIK